MHLQPAVFGSLCHALTTSSLLGAVGISAGPAATTAASAAIRWITKDGLGGLGRFVVGSRLGGELDDEWVQYAYLSTVSCDVLPIVSITSSGSA